MLDKSIYKKADEIIAKHIKEKEPLFPIMKDIQLIYTSIAPELLSYVAGKLGIDEEDAYSSAGNGLDIGLKGRYVVNVCDGIACRAKKGSLILDHLYKELGLSKDKTTTDDLLFTIEPSGCLRSCGQAPVMMVNDELYPNMTPEKAMDVINKLRTEFNDILLKGPENAPSGKEISVAGSVKARCKIDIPAGTSLNTIINDFCGGLTDGSSFKLAKIGGSPGCCILISDPEYKVDFDLLKKSGTMIRTRSITIYDQNACVVDINREIMEHYVESDVCGKCVPCREGTLRMKDILNDIVEGRGSIESYELLKELALSIKDTALCGLGKAFVAPVLSIDAEAEKEFLEHINDKKCRSGACKALSNYEIIPSLCKGCSKCARNCPVSAISGEVRSPFEIDQSKCIKCGACYSGCPFKAVSLV